MEQHGNINHENWEKELKEISPFLANIPKVQPYKVPEDYFAEKETELQLIPFSKNDSFTVPAGYFENLKENILAQVKVRDIQPEKRKTAKIRKIHFQIATVVTAAAACIVLVFSLLNQNKDTTNQPLLAEVSQAEISYYLENNIDHYDENLIYQWLSEEDLSSGRLGDIQDELNGISEEEIEKYIENNVDQQLIEESL